MAAKRLALLRLALGFLLWSAAAAPAERPLSENEESTAAVTLDGQVLFHVRGVAALPAEERAERIAKRIAALGSDGDFALTGIRIANSDLVTEILGDRDVVMRVLDADASLEGIDRRALALVYADRIRQALQTYRDDRSEHRLRSASRKAIVAGAAFLGLLWLTLWAMRRFTVFAESRVRQHVKGVAVQSFQLINARHVWLLVTGALYLLRVVVFIALIEVFLEYVLSLFPWTRPISRRLLEYALGPLEGLGSGLVRQLPNILFLAVMLFVTRYVLRALRLFFEAVERGSVELKSFEREWARPTHRLARFVVVLIAIVIAYPYIPGAQSDAFKGVSLLLGVLLSLGSSSFTSNLIAGFALTYRRVFKPGDRVSIDGAIGDVLATRLQVTHLRSLKNEEIIVPNSTILNNRVVNYSSLARMHALILHTAVGIGYEVPWRQVEAMLLMAADRTQELLREPKPFVLQTALGDFAVIYELNVHCGDAHRTLELYHELHRNILDVFNEYGVQIMTPAYQRDPREPKVVPPDRWFTTPAVQSTFPPRQVYTSTQARQD